MENQGNLVASYSHNDNNIKVWKLGSEGFFESLIKRSAEEYKSVHLRQEVPKEFKYHLKIVWINKKTLKLMHSRSSWAIEVKV